MLMRFLSAATMLAVLHVASIKDATAQSFPTRPVTVVMPFAAGGPGDVIARVVGQSMSATLGQQILVENTAGAGGTIGAARVAVAQPDGYTLLMTHIGHATGPALYASLKYDAVKDFEPIGLVADHPMLFVAKKGFPADSFPAFISHLKANADKLTWGHAGIGSASHLCGALLFSDVGVQSRGVVYRGAGLVMNDLISGQIDFMCDQPVNVIGNAAQGNIKAYAVTGKTKLPGLPGLPDVASMGIKGLDLTIWNGLYAPKGTPKPAIDRLSAALQAAMVDETVRSKLAALGVDVMRKEQATPEALAAHLKAETERWVPVLRKAGVTPQ